MKDLAIIFARAPRLGTVKRRLAAEIGDRAALQFHKDCTTSLIRSLLRDRRFETILALTPDRPRIRLPVRIPRLSQGQGNLGQRMARAFRRFPHRRVALIGSDIPEASAIHLRASFAALGTAHAVFGPALDGGYWLVALGPRRPCRPFDAVRWSSPHALGDTLANFRSHRVTFLETLRDIDAAADLRAWRQATAPRGGAGRPAIPTDARVPPL